MDLSIHTAYKNDFKSYFVILSHLVKASKLFGISEGHLFLYDHIIGGD